MTKDTPSCQLTDAEVLGILLDSGELVVSDAAVGVKVLLAIYTAVEEREAA